MNCTRLFVVMTLLFCFSTLTSAAFDKERSESLLKNVKDTKLLKVKGNKRAKRNKKIVESAQNLLATKLSSCTPAVCFAIDGSNALSANQFDTQISFVELAAALLGALNGAQLAAVQYAGSALPISPLVFANPDGPTFLADVGSTIHQQSNKGIVKAGIQYCIQQFGNNMPSKILILGDSDTNYGTVSQKNQAITIAQNWDNLGLGNDLCAGLIGHGNKSFFVQLVGGVNTDVRRPKNWDLLIEDIEDFFNAICN